MAQEFLHQLLRIENTVQIDENEARDCMICLERYGALNSSTGGVELLVRLPCNHLVGTICIATWLRENNSCPACRAIFFQAQPRPYLEHGIMDDHDHELGSTRTERVGDWDETDPLDFCEWLCLELHLEVPVVVMARYLTHPISQRLQGEAHSPECNAAISVYIAWHLSNQGDNDSNFLTNLSRISIGQDHIRSTWASIYLDRMELILPEILPTLAEGHIEGILEFLPTPVFDPDEDKDRDSQVSDQRGTFDQEADNFAVIDRRLYEILRDEDLVEDVKHVCDIIVTDMLYQADVEGWSAVLDDYSTDVCHAMCDFMACHFMGVAITHHDAARIYNTSERSVRQLYAYVFPRCSGFIDPDVTEVMGNRDLYRVLGALPNLNWPSA